MGQAKINRVRHSEEVRKVITFYDVMQELRNLMNGSGFLFRLKFAIKFLFKTL